jgi:hypothetical protein
MPDAPTGIPVRGPAPAARGGAARHVDVSGDRSSVLRRLDARLRGLSVRTSTTARSVDEVVLIRDTRSHYAAVINPTRRGRRPENLEPAPCPFDLGPDVLTLLD